MGTIVTFYSYKGGVGRTMALANIGVLLCAKGKRVLAVDWDLEAPGLDRYFAELRIRPSKRGGLLQLLTSRMASQANDWRDHVAEIPLGTNQRLWFISAGDDDADYPTKLAGLDWGEFFATHQGGAFIESLRDEWKSAFDIVLVDSRTGLTDSGGICTIQIPDVLVAVFTANNQSLMGAKQIVSKAQDARQRLAFDRMPLVVLPLPSRIDGRTEFEETQSWLDRFAETWSACYNDWLLPPLTPRYAVERTKVPHIAYFSFGERLPVLSHGTTDPESIGFAYETSADLIAGDFQDAGRVLGREATSGQAEMTTITIPHHGGAHLGAAVGPQRRDSDASDSASILRLLASSNSERADLFVRVMTDLFFALGYDDLRVNVAKSGREIDIAGQHRFEARRVLAECKAHREPMGGKDLNVFLGIVTRERLEAKAVPVEAYFISLSGFTAAATEQERWRDAGGLILLDGHRVVQELERCKVVVSSATAVERAVQMAAHAGVRGDLDGTQLLGHEHGYLWAVYYARNKERTHFTLIHADGTPLAEAVAREVVEADRRCGGTLAGLRYICPPVPDPDWSETAAAALDRYRRWLAEECGYIQLDGLPADSELSATRIRLERLFVPLSVLPSGGGRASAGAFRLEDVPSESREDPKPLPAGQALAETARLAILAAPGGGKSALLKRLALAYAFPERRAEIADDLPERDWLPLLLRCRDLRGRSNRPLLELLDDLPGHAGMDAEETDAFGRTVHEAVQAGRALVLIDGLDEIADEGERLAFAERLRTFVAVFPKAALVVTSRAAGFRLVVGVVASVCRCVTIAPLNQEGVARLCQVWHREVVGDSGKVRADAAALAATIREDEHIWALAENPLMLTTLLVVKRYIGDLPQKRAALYAEAVKVLIRTWNVAGHAPMDEDEALAQLSYAACAMMEQGIQRIDRRALLALLCGARRELEAELGFSRISIPEFIERIEGRSSLLMQTGHDLVDGRLEPVYEFRHLTFQEYLCAYGLVRDLYPGRGLARPLADLLEPHFDDEAWREVIALAAVLAGRRAEETIQRLTDACRALPNRNPRVACAALLRRCILDEVQVAAATLTGALREIARRVSDSGLPESVRDIRCGRFGDLFNEIAEEAYLRGSGDWFHFRQAAHANALFTQFAGRKPPMGDAIATTLARALRNGTRLERLRAAFVVGQIACEASPDPGGPYPPLPPAALARLRDELRAAITPEDWPLAAAACSALYMIAKGGLATGMPAAEVVLALLRVWSAAIPEASYSAALALATQPLLSRDAFGPEDWAGADWSGPCQVDERDADAPWLGRARLVVAWYRREPWHDEDLVERIDRLGADDWPTGEEMLGTLGEAGRLSLVKLDQRRQRRARERYGRSPWA